MSLRISAVRADAISGQLADGGGGAGVWDAVG